jgi:hypothetical protein
LKLVLTKQAINEISENQIHLIGLEVKEAYQEGYKEKVTETGQKISSERRPFYYITKSFLYIKDRGWTV